MHVVLRGATVVDGTGEPARRADVEVKDGRIGAVGEIGKIPGAEDVDLSGSELSRVSFPGSTLSRLHLREARKDEVDLRLNSVR